MRSWSSRRSGISIARFLAAALFLLPILWMALAALHPPGSLLPQSLKLWPDQAGLESLKAAWRSVPFGRYTLNSSLVVLLAVPLTLITSSWAGLAMARLPRSSQRRWILLSLAVLMVPGAAVWSTRFLIYKQLGLLDTIWSLIAPAVMGTSPFYVLIFYRAFRRIPPAIFDAARIDGASIIQTWGFVALPAARPSAVGVALLSLVYYWGDFNSPLLYVTSPERSTVPIALQLLQELGRSDWPIQMAGAMLATAVPIAIFLLLQPYFARIKD